MVSNGTGENMQACDIQPDETRDLTFEFRLYPPLRDYWQPFTPHSIAFFDQFGNMHSVKRISFQGRMRSTSILPKKPSEFQYELGAFPTQVSPDAAHADAPLLLPAPNGALVGRQDERFGAQSS
jgi:hypothetical protein